MEGKCKCRKTRGRMCMLSLKLEEAVKIHAEEFHMDANIGSTEVELFKM